MRGSRAPLQPKEDPEITAQEHQTDYHEDDKRFRREDFERKLKETGLELERHEEVRRGRGYYFYIITCKLLSTFSPLTHGA